MRSWRHSLLMLLVGALASSVKAADITVPPAQPAPPGWIITVGADARAVPRYMGSNQVPVQPNVDDLRIR
jgi:hypothetical protein